MQTNLSKRANFFDRILQIIDYYDIKNVNSFAKNYLKYDSSEKINRLKKENSNPSVEILKDISNKFEDVSVEWLLTGKGNMLKNEQKTISAVAVLSNSNTKGVPLVYPTAVAGFGSERFTITEQDIKEYYVIPKFKYLNIDFMIEISGSSMYPKYNSGDVIACTIIKNSNFIQWNKTHLIATKEQGLIVKRLKKSEREGYLTAISDNKNYPPFDIPTDEIMGIALVVGVIRLE